jgi:hypothetical protein
MLFQVDQAYFTEVLKRLDALHERAPKGSVLFELATEGIGSIGGLVGYFFADSRKGCRST